MSRLTESITQARDQQLALLGLSINQIQVYSKWAKAAGRTVASMTELEKRQAFTNAVVERGATLQSVYAASLETVGKKFTSMDRYVQEATTALGKQFQPILAGVVQGITSLSKYITEMNDAQRQAILSFGAFTVSAAAAIPILAALSIAAAAFNPAALALVAGLGYLGASFVSAQMKAQNFSSAITSAREETTRSTARMMMIGDAVQEVEKLAQSGDKSAESQRKLNTAISMLLTLTGPAAAELSKFASVEELLANVAKKFPAAVQPAEERLKALREQFQKAKAELQTATAERQKVLPGMSHNRNDWTTEEAHRYDSATNRYKNAVEEMSRADAALKAYQDKMLSDRVKYYETLAQGMDEAFNTATELESKIEELKTKRIKSPIFEASSNIDDIRKTLSLRAMTEDQIRERADAKFKKDRLALIGASEKQIAAENDTNKRVELRAQLERNLIALQNEKDAGIQDELDKRSKILEMLAKSKQYGIDLLEIEERKIAAQVEVYDRLRSGESEAAIRADIEAREELIANLESEKALQEDLAELRERQKKAGEEDKELLDDISLKERELADQRRKTIVDQLNNIQELQKANKDEVEDHKKRVEDLQKSIQEYEKDTTSLVIDEIKTRQEARRKDLEDVRKFIQERQLAETERRLPGTKAIVDLQNEYSSAIKKAQTPDQISDLTKLASGDFQAQMDEIQKRGQALRRRLSEQQMRNRGGRPDSGMRDQIQELNDLRAQWFNMWNARQRAESALAEQAKRRRAELEQQQGLEKKEKAVIDQKVAADRQLLSTEQARLRTATATAMQLERQLSAIRQMIGAQGQAQRPQLPSAPPFPVQGPIPPGARFFNVPPEKVPLVSTKNLPAFLARNTPQPSPLANLWGAIGKGAMSAIPRINDFLGKRPNTINGQILPHYTNNRPNTINGLPLPHYAAGNRPNTINGQPITGLGNRPSTQTINGKQFITHPATGPAFVPRPKEQQDEGEQNGRQRILANRRKSYAEEMERRRENFAALKDRRRTIFQKRDDRAVDQDKAQRAVGMAQAQRQMFQPPAPQPQQQGGAQGVTQQIQGIRQQFNQAGQMGTQAVQQLVEAVKGMAEDYYAQNERMAQDAEAGRRILQNRG